MPPLDQYDRITQILLSQATPRAMPLDPTQAASALISSLGTNKSYSDTMMNRQDKALERERQYQSDQLSNAQNLLNVYNAKKAAGDAMTQALDSKIQLFTGGDPEGTAMFLQELHNDPEEIDPGNSYQVMTKLAAIAKRNGYKSPEREMERKIKEADVAYKMGLAGKKTGAGGGSSPDLSQENAMDTIPDMTEDDVAAILADAGAVDQPMPSDSPMPPPLPAKEGTAQTVMPQQKPSVADRFIMPSYVNNAGTGPERQANRLREYQNAISANTPLTTGQLQEYNTLLSKLNPGEAARIKEMKKAAGTDIDNLKDRYVNFDTIMNRLKKAKTASDKLPTTSQGTLAGYVKNFSTAAKELDAEQTSQALQYVNQTKGAVSDREMGMFAGASVGTDKPKEFNQRVLEAAQAVMVRNKQQYDFYQKWIRRYGSDDGAYEAFKQFAEENPILSDETFKLVKPINQLEKDKTWENYLNNYPYPIVGNKPFSAVTKKKETEQSGPVSAEDYFK